MSVTTAWNQNLRQICNNDDNYLRWSKANRSDRIRIVSKPYASPIVMTPPTRLQRTLLDTAEAVRESLISRNNNDTTTMLPSPEELFFDSSFNKSGRPRGFCNWLIPGVLMVGQYPGQNPLQDGPCAEAVASHLQRIITRGHVSVFCSLQCETPPQTMDECWEDHKVYLKPEYRQELPRPFVQYAPLVKHYCSTSNNMVEVEPVFLHKPIEDLSVPDSQEPLLKLLLQLLEHMLTSPEKPHPVAVYVHCWGGLGRAGLIGACLLSLIYPQLSSKQVLQWVQTGYATRLGHAHLEEQYAYSPQTCPQRAFVEAFVQEYQGFFQEKCQSENDEE
jgi:Cyclin-dependent kinase inhibitor 3 (CDKN3)